MTTMGGICIMCGKPLPKGRSVYCSDLCRSRHERERAKEGKNRKKGGAYIWRTCTDCGTIFYGNIKSFRCPNCQYDANLKHAAEHRKRNRAGTTRPLGSTDLCAWCGKPYIVKSGRQKYCPACREIATKDAIQKHAVENYNAKIKNNREKRDEINKRKRWVPTEIFCKNCGNSFIPKHGRQFCSDKCKVEYEKKYRKKYAQLKKKKELPMEGEKQ